MKKMLSILLAVMMIATLALTGCGQNNDPAPTPDPEPTPKPDPAKTPSAASFSLSTIWSRTLQMLAA